MLKKTIFNKKVILFIERFDKLLLIKGQPLTGRLGKNREVQAQGAESFAE